ncbi:MAG: enoyl-CoA hydratase/isomerase family protein [Stellaceae bacterium]
MTVRLTRIDELALVTLDRPTALNALDFAMLRELAAVFDEIASGDTRALLVTGAGDRAFCAGADVAELVGRSLAAARGDAAFGQATLAKLDNLPIPSIALVNGYALGGGLELALACTFRITAPGARLGLPEIKLGLIPGYGGTQRLPRLIGEARALDLILTGRAVDADEALAIGLVNRIAAGDLVEAGTRFAREMTGFSQAAQRLARAAVRRGLDASLTEGLAIEADLNAAAFQTADAIEGITAFLEKRKPLFHDR